MKQKKEMYVFPFHPISFKTTVISLAPLRPDFLLQTDSNKIAYILSFFRSKAADTSVI